MTNSVSHPNRRKSRAAAVMAFSAPGWKHSFANSTAAQIGCGSKVEPATHSGGTMAIDPKAPKAKYR